MKNRGKRKNSPGFGVMAVMLVIGVLGGILMTVYLGSVFEEYGLLLSLAFKLAIFLLCYYFQLIIHELGHLVAGLISGYGFGSFRIGSIMLVKRDGRLTVKRQSVAGTGGQCLMVPPPMVDGKIPVVFYNLGGVLMNFLTLPVCVLLLASTIGRPCAMTFCVMMFFAGFIIVLTNGIPLKLGMVNNDGSNARELRKNREAMRVFHNQFMCIHELGNGKRLKEMPEEWFFMPSEQGMKNSIAASGAVFRENRLMDEGGYDEALELINRLLASDTALVGLYKNLLICDKITLLLLRSESEGFIGEVLGDKNFQVFLKQMKGNPSVVRTRYAVALLLDRDAQLSATLKEEFERCARVHPYAPDIESERELIALIEAKN